MTLGGNLCLDTRCNYYDQNYEWRKAINFCLKKDGDTCWVAPGSSKCMAVSSTDTAPALIALGARVRLVSRTGEREVLLADLYNNDGLDYIKRKSNEILAEVMLDSLHGWKSTYWKLRRRGSFDFPVLSVAAAVRISDNGVVEEARIVIGSAASRPLIAGEAAKSLAGRPLNADSIAEGCGSRVPRIAAARQHGFRYELAKKSYRGICDLRSARIAWRRRAQRARDFHAHMFVVIARECYFSSCR